MDPSAMPAKSRYFIETFGCQMNVNDSEKVAGLLQADGYEPAASAEGTAAGGRALIPRLQAAAFSS